MRDMGFEIIGLKTEYAENPIHIGVRRPRFSWAFCAYPGFRQRTLRIMVASSEEGILAGNFDLWDSGVVREERNFGIEYAGKPLASRTRAFWRCEITDTKGRTETSGAARFETALLDESDWKGKWISMPPKYSGGALYFRHEFTLPDRKIVRASAYLCGIGFLECHVNGKRMGRSVLDPAVTDYGKRALYCAYDVTQALHAGANCTGIVVGHGWFGDRKLLAQFYVDFEDGSCFEAHTDHCGWWVGSGPIVKDSIYDGEEYDARAEEGFEGWTRPGFDSVFTSGWVFAMRVPGPGGALEPQTAEPVEVVGEYPCKLVFQTECRAVYDTGQNLAGWAKVTVRGARGARLTLRFAERLKEDGREIDRLNLRSAEATDVYILKGGGPETYAPRFTYHGFQYVETLTEGDAEVLEITAQAVRSAVPEAGRFSCSDETLNRLHRMAVMTESANLHGIMTDCPQRDERFGWLNDITSRIFQTVCNFNMARFFPKFVRDIRDTQNEAGMISDTVPAGIGSTAADPVSISYLLLAEASFKLYGDRGIIRENYASFQAWTDYLFSISKDDLLAYSLYGDWVEPAGADVPPAPRTPKAFISSAYLFWYAKLMRRFAEILDRGEDARRYAELAARVKKAFNRKYFDAERCRYGTGGQGCNSIALSLGLCEEAHRKRLAKRVADDIVSRGFHPTTGNQSYRHMFYSLSDEGFTDVLLAMLKNPEYPGWGYMLACGATTVWERWEREMKKSMNSFCHPMFASYDGWLYNKVAGIGFSEDCEGARKMVFAPCVPSELEYACAELDTIHGRASCSWRKSGDTIRYEITVPPNVSARIRIDRRLLSVEGGERRVNESGELEVGGGVFWIVAEGRRA